LRKSFTIIENLRSESDFFNAKYLKSFAKTDSIEAGYPVISTFFPPERKLLEIPIIFYSTKVPSPSIVIEKETV
jgi:hypothetical protein